MYWLRTKFKDWAATQGVELIRDDFKFIEKILYRLPEDLHKSIMREFVYEWQDGLGKDDKSSPNQNLGRFKASMWLRSKLE